jgi:hypothetical protein
MAPIALLGKRHYAQRDMAQQPDVPDSFGAGDNPGQRPGRVSDELKQWLAGGGDKTLGSLIGLVEKKGFAIVFVVLLAVPALPLPTGGATHVLEIIAILLAVQLIAGRGEIWVPQRWRRLRLVAGKRQRFVRALIKLIGSLERISRPRLRFLFNHRLSNVVFGLLVVGGSLAAFFAPPFSGLDTLPSLGVVLLSLGVLLEDFVAVVVALLVGVAGIFLEVVLGGAALSGLKSLF